MCAIDWGFVAAWIGALATVGLVVAAFLGYGIWKKQFFKQRNHDLALRLLRAVSNSYVKLDELRSPTLLITDDDVPVRPSEFADSNTDLEFRAMSARYRARKKHLTDVVEERIAALNEALVVWDEFGETLGDILNELGNMESQVSREVAIFLEGLALRAEGDIDYPNREILYSPTDAAAEDVFADEYQMIIGRIRTHLGPKIRME